MVKGTTLTCLPTEFALHTAHLVHAMKADVDPTQPLDPSRLSLAEPRSQSNVPPAIENFEAQMMSVRHCFPFAQEGHVEGILNLDPTSSENRARLFGLATTFTRFAIENTVLLQDPELAASEAEAPDLFENNPDPYTPITFFRFPNSLRLNTARALVAIGRLIKAYDEDETGDLDLALTAMQARELRGLLSFLPDDANGAMENFVSLEQDVARMNSQLTLPDPIAIQFRILQARLCMRQGNIMLEAAHQYINQDNPGIATNSLTQALLYYEREQETLEELSPHMSVSEVEPFADEIAQMRTWNDAYIESAGILLASVSQGGSARQEGSEDVC